MAIKDWEIGHFKSELIQTNKEGYIEDLESKRLKFINEFENLP